MAERRMFTKKVTDDDNFMSLSASAQALYLHLSMSADDDGFCNQVTVSMFKAHASVADLEALLSKRYLYQFENGVIVIKHWRMANALRKDRYTPTAFQEELARLQIKDNGAYTLAESERLPDGCQMVANRLPDGCQTVAACLPQDRLGKNSLDKDIKRESKKRETQRRFTPPTRAQVQQFCIDNSIVIDIDGFIDYYTSNGWLVGGRSHMKDWKAAVRNWQRRDKAKQTQPTNRFAAQMIHSDYTIDESEFIDN